MGYCFSAAALLLFVIGLLHSVLGERLLFRWLRRGGLVPTDGGDRLREYQVRILWANWHLVTLLGWLLAGAIHSLPQWPADLARPAALAAAFTLLACALLVLVGTRGRHPGWVGLLLVAALTGIGGLGLGAA